jgi:uncharacterized membrane protein
VITLEAPEAVLAHAAAAMRFLLEALSVGTVLVGLLATLRQARCLRRAGNRSLRPTANARLTFGSWLSLALEFQLGADIVSTTSSPTRDNLIQLAVVAVIRTFLNVFLARELEAEMRFEQDQPRDGVHP